jgi:hypothetical protein
MNAYDSSNQLKIREYPIALIITGLCLLGAAVFFYFKNAGLIPVIILGLISLLVLLVFATVTTITIDKNQGLFSISKHSVLLHKRQDIPLHEIANFEIEATRSHSSSSHHNHQTTYRIVMVKTSGEKVPLQGYYSSGYGDKAQKARQYCEFLNLPGWEDKPTNLIQAAMQAQVNLTRQVPQAAPQGPDGASQEKGVTSGVSWWIERHAIGGQPVTRWVSSDFCLPGSFLLISQKPHGSSSLGGGGFLAGLVKMALQQVIGMYGFLPSDLPGFEQANALPSSGGQLDQDYSLMSNDPYSTSRLLNSYLLNYLATWAQRHPMGNITRPNQLGQLVVLFSPRATYVAALGTLTKEQLDEIIALSAAIVQSQSLSPNPNR